MPMNDNQRLNSEIEMIQRVYKKFDREDRSKHEWAPFNENEAAFRAMQQLTFSEILRDKGLKDLEFLEMGSTLPSLTGVDIRINVLNEGKAILPVQNFTLFNGWQLPFPNRSFDLITQFVVFSSISDELLRITLAQEIERVLKPGGYIFWWDLSYMTENAGGDSKKLDPMCLFPLLKASKLSIGKYVNPSRTIRNLKGLKRFITPFVDLIAIRKNHTAAIFGPKE
jgi:ubiquinone/menaquinone biosynthesis C-methylase UbiE